MVSQRPLDSHMKLLSLVSILLVFLRTGGKVGFWVVGMSLTGALVCKAEKWAS